MKSICKTSAEARPSPGSRRLAWLLLALCLASCATLDPPPTKLALLAPFESRHREIGYNALYAARLAFADAAPGNIELLALDDGGTLESAVARVKALKLDPAVAVIIALGPAATHAKAQLENDKPMIVIGNWGQERADEDSLFASNPALAQARGRGDLEMLEQARGLAATRSTAYFSSGALPDASFRQRYLESAMYAPAPNWLATLTYDMTRLALTALSQRLPLSAAHYAGINGEIQFEAGYWLGAPVHGYQVADGQLLQLPARAAARQ